MILARRRLLGALGAGAGGLMLSGCDKLNENPTFKGLLNRGEKVTMFGQRLITDRSALAPQFTAADLSPVFRSNGTARPGSAEYAAHAANRFADWKLTIDGLVQRPQSVSLAQIGRMPVRTQITRHDCVEGWSAIGKWHGVPLKLLLDQAGPRQDAKYIVFHCADDYGASRYYESIDLVDAFHPQTILAWGLNDHLLPVQNGAPLRLRVERQLGYKQAKYVERIEAVASLAGIGAGKGGFWEDDANYEWYAGA